MFTSSVEAATSHHGGSDNGDGTENIHDMHLCKTSDSAHSFVKGFPVT